MKSLAVDTRIESIHVSLRHKPHYEKLGHSLDVPVEANIAPQTSSPASKRALMVLIMLKVSMFVAVLCAIASMGAPLLDTCARRSWGLLLARPPRAGRAARFARACVSSQRIGECYAQAVVVRDPEPLHRGLPRPVRGPRGRPRDLRASRCCLAIIPSYTDSRIRRDMQ